MTRGVYEITTRDPVLRAIFERALELKIGDRKLATISGYSMNSIYSYRTGRAASPRLNTLIDWAQAVGLNLTVSITEEKP